MKDESRRDQPIAYGRCSSTTFEIAESTGTNIVHGTIAAFQKLNYSVRFSASEAESVRFVTLTHSAAVRTYRVNRIGICNQA
jgi:hypothetical protein